MAIHKVNYLGLLLFFGMILLASNVEHADAYALPKPCPRNCDPEIAVEICPRPEKSKKVDLNRLCTNCCAGIKGCSYFSAEGKFVCKGESDPQNPKACPLNCDPRIAYGICPLVEKKRRICTNCCAGKKGCYYYGENENFICEGESEYDVSEGENDFQKIKLPVSQF